MKSIRLSLVYFTLVGCVSVAEANALRTVALSGNNAPGTDAIFSKYLGYHRSHHLPVLNNKGQVAFFGRLGGSEVDSSNRMGLWSEGSGSLALVAREGDRAPGTQIFFSTFRSSLAPALNDLGQTTFSADLTGSETSSWNGGVWSEGSGSLALVAREGNQAPGTGESFASFSSPSFLNNAGQTAFFGATVEGNQGVWSEGSGSLALVARNGDEAPGTDQKFSFVYLPAFNDAGQTAFWGAYTDPESNRRNKFGVWSEGSGSLALVANEGGMAPGTSGKFTDLDGSIPLLNNSGQTAFRATFTDPDSSVGGGSGIWSEGSGSLALVAGTGDAAPGTSASFRSFFYPDFNDSGQTAFLATLSGPEVSAGNDWGIWSEGNGSLAMVVREGDSAPGTNGEFSFFDNLAFNGAGQTAILARFTGTGTEAGGTGIWAQDPSGELRLIIRTGAEMDVDEGPGTDFRTVKKLSFGLTRSGPPFYRPNIFNDRGQLAFSASFTDGTSGIFVSNLVAIPEPTGAMLLFTTLAVCGVRRRRS